MLEAPSIFLGVMGEEFGIFWVHFARALVNGPLKIKSPDGWKFGGSKRVGASKSVVWSEGWAVSVSMEPLSIKG